MEATARGVRQVKVWWGEKRVMRSELVCHLLLLMSGNLQGRLLSESNMRLQSYPGIRKFAPVTFRVYRVEVSHSEETSVDLKGCFLLYCHRFSVKQSQEDITGWKYEMSHCLVAWAAIISETSIVKKRCSRFLVTSRHDQWHQGTWC